MSDYTISNVRFTSFDGHSRVHGWVYAPKTEAIALLQISHGMCEYIGRYHWFMEALCRQGFVVFGNDHIGHGESSEPEQYGFFGEKNGYQNLIADLHRMTSIVKEKYQNLPVFLLGHSMGSFVARLYLSRYGEELQGAILCGTSGPNPLAKAGALVASAAIQLKGPMWRSTQLTAMAFGSYNRNYESPRTTHDWLTRDESIVDAYLQDPKCTFLFTACGYRDLFTMLCLCNHRDWYAAVPKNLPILLISGDMDPVGDYGKGIRKVLEQLVKHGTEDASMILYPAARHELLNEQNKEEVLTHIQQWLTAHLPENRTEAFST